MPSRRGNLQDSPDNPFNPGFGVAPPLLAGRQEILHGVLTGLGRGAGRHEFHSVIVGPRGTGKTVLLAEIERFVTLERQSVVVRWSGTEPLSQRISEQQPLVDALLAGATRRGLRRVEPELSVKAAPGGVGVEARFGARQRQIGPSVHALLEHLATAAKKRHRTVVLLADELQAATSDDLRQLGVTIQDVANVRRLPLALVGAGLPNTQQAFQQAKVTFLERFNFTHIGLLGDGDTRDAIEIPVIDAGKRITPAALDIVARASGGYPYAIQLAGSFCWQAAGEETELTARHARTAARRTGDELSHGVFATSWQRVSPGDRAYLVAAARLVNPRGEARTAGIADMLGRQQSATSASRDRLINRHGVLYAPERGVVKFMLPGFAEWVARQADTHHP